MIGTKCVYCTSESFLFAPQKILETKLKSKAIFSKHVIDLSQILPISPVTSIHTSPLSRRQLVRFCNKWVIEIERREKTKLLFLKLRLRFYSISPRRKL